MVFCLLDTQSHQSYVTPMALHRQMISFIDNMSEKKTVFLCTTIKFMGLELDYIKFEIKLSEDKLLRLQNFNNVLKRKRTDTLRELRSLICLLNFSVELMIS